MKTLSERVDHLDQMINDGLITRHTWRDLHNGKEYVCLLLGLFPEIDNTGSNSCIACELPTWMIYLAPRIDDEVCEDENGKPYWTNTVKQFAKAVRAAADFEPRHWFIVYLRLISDLADCIRRFAPIEGSEYRLAVQAWRVACQKSIDEIIEHHWGKQLISQWVFDPSKYLSAADASLSYSPVTSRTIQLLTKTVRDYKHTNTQATYDNPGDLWRLIRDTRDYLVNMRYCRGESYHGYHPNFMTIGSRMLFRHIHQVAAEQAAREAVKAD